MSASERPERAEAASRKGPGRPAGARSGETREAILRAARELLAERGLPRVTLREVAERAGVQAGLVNYYFDGKQGLFRDVIRSVASEVRERIAAQAVAPGTPPERAANAVRAVIGAFAEYPFAPRLLFDHVLFAEDDTLDEFVENYARPNLAVLEALFAAGQQDGSLRETEMTFLMPQVMGMAAFLFLASPLITRVFGLDGIDPELARRFADSTAELLLNGLRAPSEEAAS